MIDPDWYTDCFKKEKIPKYLMVMVAVVLMVFLSSAFSGCSNARCPYCGHRFNIYNLNER